MATVASTVSIQEIVYYVDLGAANSNLQHQKSKSHTLGLEIYKTVIFTDFLFCHKTWPRDFSGKIFIVAE